MITLIRLTNKIPDSQQTYFLGSYLHA